jgi:hypothetical protein
MPICCKRICCCGGIEVPVLKDCRERYLDCSTQPERKAFLLKMRDINSPTNFAGNTMILQLCNQCAGIFHYKRKTNPPFSSFC